MFSAQNPVVQDRGVRGQRLAGRNSGDQRRSNAGTDFTAASAVKFGDTPAATLAGTSLTTGGDRFNYEACVVPKLKGNSAHHGQNRQRQDRDRDHREGGAGREPAAAA